MITVYKYPFKIADHFEIDLPQGARILKVETQDDIPCIWALVDTDQKPLPHGYWIFGTGHQIDSGSRLVGEHVASFQQGPFVWHLFANALNPS